MKQRRGYLPSETKAWEGRISHPHFLFRQFTEKRFHLSGCHCFSCCVPFLTSQGTTTCPSSSATVARTCRTLETGGARRADTGQGCGGGTGAGGQGKQQAWEGTEASDGMPMDDKAGEEGKSAGTSRRPRRRRRRRGQRRRGHRHLRLRS